MLSGYVYLMTCPERFKIGFSTDPHVRRTSLRNKTKLDLRLVALICGGRALEKQVMHFFRAHRLDGEWFAPSQDILNWFAHHRHFVDPGLPRYPFPNGSKPAQITEDVQRLMGAPVPKSWVRDQVIKATGSARRKP